ncbi:Phosphodiesterase/alkaline phosphatase D [Caballeronia arationis]|jgi:alkaline phosphatase D|uniref:Phosphodiesterase/alkaline phosphatase D n=1 Tax=Caballeronia arationis TaxID=1777142 RepID=A0A7Z7I9V5_9BURK|nr:alkaline phosphatase D family protein [Caballeronia arationis]SOE81813.1 Phosphodiesterase/alkaline phosphatase D [Caballeronia arationis]
MDRRRFLSLSTFYTVVAATGTLAACHGGSDDSNSGGSPVPPPPAGSFAFPQGVASGDPRDTSAVFWTRCTGTATNTTAAVSLRLDVSAQADFSNPVASVQLSALPDYDFTVRTKVTGLAAKTTYYYRFVAGSDVSPMGTTRTAPAASEANPQVRFAWFVCQNWSANHWQAMSLLATETDLDFVVHLGDYIYETAGAAQTAAVEPAHAAIALPDGLALPAGGTYANTVNDYRTLYRTYRGDTRLQAVHARFPVIAIWDDHEFSDDCWQDHQTYTNENKQQTERRRSANQAWAEYLPVDWGDVSFDLRNGNYDNIRIYRDFHFGSLMHLVMTDERLYRDDHVVSEASVAQALGHDPVNGSDPQGSRYFVPQGALQQFEALDTQRLGRVPSILGPTQTQWWKDTLKSSIATWKVWGNEVMMNRLWIDLSVIAPSNSGVFVIDCDSWDGYPSHKADLLSFVKMQGIANLVAITGDLHAFQAGVVRDDPNPSTGTPALVDLMSAGISSTSFFGEAQGRTAGTPFASLVASPQVFDALLKLNNPDLKYADHDAQGYASATVTPGQFVAIFNKVKGLNADGSAPQAPLAKRTRLTVNAGAAGTSAVIVEDNV